MSHPSGKVRYIMEGEDRNLARVVKLITKAVQDGHIQFRKMAGEVDNVNRSMGSLGTTGGGALKALGSQAASLLASFVGIQQALRLVRQEWEYIQQKQQTALQTRLDVSSEMSRALAMLQSTPGLGGKFGVAELMSATGPEMQQRSSQPRVELLKASPEILSASGFPEITQRDITSAYELGGKMARLAGAGGDVAGRFGSAALDMIRATGVHSTEAGLGALLFSTRQARISALQESAITVPRAIQAGREFGMPPAFSSAILAFITGRINDITGDQSVTAAVNINRMITGKANEFPTTSDVWTTVGGRLTKVTSRVSGPAAFGILPGGFTSPIDPFLRTLDAALADETGRSVAALQNVYGSGPGRMTAEGIVLGAMPRDRRDARAWVRRAFRSPEDTMQWMSNQVLNMTAEERDEFFNKIIARSASRGPIEGLFLGEPEDVGAFRELLAQSREIYADERKAVAYGVGRIKQMEAGGANLNMPIGRAQAIAQERQLENSARAAQGLFREMLTPIWNSMDKTWTETTLADIEMQVRNLGGSATDARQNALKILRRKYSAALPSTQTLWGSINLAGGGEYETITSPGQRDDAAALKAAIGVIEGIPDAALEDFLGTYQREGTAIDSGASGFGMLAPPYSGLSAALSLMAIGATGGDSSAGRLGLSGGDSSAGRLGLGGSLIGTASYRPEYPHISAISPARAKRHESLMRRVREGAAYAESLAAETEPQPTDWRGAMESEAGARYGRHLSRLERIAARRAKWQEAGHWGEADERHYQLVYDQANTERMAVGRDTPAKQIILVNAAATPWYQTPTPLQGGVGVN